MEEKKQLSREEVMKRVNDRLNETRSAQTGVELPKGTAMEDEMIKAEQPDVLPEHPDKIIAEEKKRGRGRPAGSGKGKYKVKKVVKKKEADGSTSETVSESEQEHPPVENHDFLTPAVNITLVPLIAWITKKEAEHLRITDMQAKELAKLQPPDANLLKPSWPAYFGMMAVVIAGNAMSAPKQNSETAELAEIKKALAKSIEVEKMRVEVAELTKKFDSLQSKMNANPNGQPAKRWEEEIAFEEIQN